MAKYEMSVGPLAYFCEAVGEATVENNGCYIERQLDPDDAETFLDLVDDLRNTKAVGRTPKSERFTVKIGPVLRVNQDTSTIRTARKEKTIRGLNFKEVLRMQKKLLQGFLARLEATARKHGILLE